MPEKPTEKTPDNYDEPNLSISMEETALVKEGLEALPIDRKKTVVFDRLLMKVGKAETYWQKIEKVRQAHREQLANQLMDKRTR
jgi:hypothetical protein